MPSSGHPPPPPGPPPGRSSRPTASGQRPAAVDVSEITEEPLPEPITDGGIPEQRERALSFDDVYALAPTQDGLSKDSLLAFIPLDGGAGVRRASSADDLEALLGGGYGLGGYDYADYDDLASQDDATVMSAPAFGAHAGSRRAPGAASLDGGGNTHTQEELDPADWEVEEPRSRRRAAGVVDDDAWDDPDPDDEDEELRALLPTPSERLFGRARARELRQRIVRQRDVSEEQAADALNAASAAMVDTGGTETLEFLSWFSTWLLVIFYLLFYSSYGPTLWRFLYGPMGAVLSLPFVFALLFYLAAYILHEDPSDRDD